MNHPTPHYLLASEANRIGGLGHWRFVLRTVDDSTQFEASDVEPDTWGERLDLLTVVRALESLDQPSRVTVTSCSRYVEHGIHYGIAEWRDSGWQWEAYGQMVPIRDSDLWQRMDRILEIHQVECGQRRLDGGHATHTGPHWHLARKLRKQTGRVKCGDWLKYMTPVLALGGVISMSVFHRLSHVTGAGAAILLHR